LQEHIFNFIAFAKEYIDPLSYDLMHLELEISKLAEIAIEDFLTQEKLAEIEPEIFITKEVELAYNSKLLQPNNYVNKLYSDIFEDNLKDNKSYKNPDNILLVREEEGVFRYSLNEAEAEMVKLISKGKEIAEIVEATTQESQKPKDFQIPFFSLMAKNILKFK